MRILLFLMFFTPSLLAQRGVISYTKEDGLISNKVNDVTYDNEGFLWIATESGLERFDGQRFIHFINDPDNKKTIAANHITRIEFDPKGYVWAATLNGGLARISTKTLSVKNFFYDKKNPGSVSDNRATSIFVDRDGDTWISQQYRGMDLYNAEKDIFVNYRPTTQFPELDARKVNQFSAILTDRNDKNTLWCCSAGGLFSFHKITKKWKYFPVVPERFIEPVQLTGREENMRCLKQDGKGNLYIGTAGGGLLYFDQNQGLFRKFSGEMPVGLAPFTISDLSWRDARYLYICAVDYEFLLFDTKTKEFIRYDKAERTIETPYHMARFGSQIAIAGSESGLFIHNESLIFGQRIRFPFTISSIAFKPGTTEWLAGNNDNPASVFFKVRDKEIRAYSLPVTDKPAGFTVSTILYMGSNGYLLICSDRIIQFVAGAGFKNRVYLGEPADSADKPMVAVNAGDSVVWIGTKAGKILHYSVTKNRLSTILSPTKQGNNEVSVSHISSLVISNNLLYFGHEEGIGVIDIKTGKRIKTGIELLLPRDEIRCMTVDHSGKLWVGTLANGIFVLDVQQNKCARTITSRMGLQTQQVDKIVRGDNNRMWVLNPKCVAIVNEKTMGIKSLENQNGIENIRDILLNRDTLYFLRNNGFITSTATNGFPRKNKPVPYIQRVRELTGKPFEFNKHVFDHQSNSLTFEFGVLDYSNGTNNFVSYRLKGLENEWHSGNGKDEASYYHLPGGNYTFQVRILEDGNLVTAEYPFRIIPPFWVRWWFITLLALILGTAVWWYTRLRIGRVKSRERMQTEFNRQINEMESKALRAQMNPHFLFNSLNSIRLFILRNEVEDASDYIAKFSKLLRMILNYSRKDMITVYDEMQSLKLYLEFERLRFDKGFEFDLEIDGQDVLDCYLPPMIIQPFVENAIWHGLMPRHNDKGHIKVAFQKQPGGLFVTVQDNGIGREEARKNNRKASLKEGSVGLQITKDRLRSLTSRTKRLNDYVIEDLMDENNQPTGTLIKLYFETEEKL